MPEPQVELNAALNAELNADADRPTWYILQQPAGHCTIESARSDASLKHWGPYDSQGTALARRVGLIRSGHCKPV
jgi:hypothetical protein